MSVASNCVELNTRLLPGKYSYVLAYSFSTWPTLYSSVMGRLLSVPCLDEAVLLPIFPIKAPTIFVHDGDDK